MTLESKREITISQKSAIIFGGVTALYHTLQKKNHKSWFSKAPFRIFAPKQ
jgi:hypothetical protein